MVRHLRLLPCLILALVLASCGQAAGPGNSVAPSSPGVQGAVQPVFAFSEAVIGRNRLALGLLRNGTPINDPGVQVSLRFYNLDENNPQPQGETQATYYGEGLPVGYYVAYATFDKPGNWGVEVLTLLPGEAQPGTARLRLPVLAKSSAPNIGERAIPVKTLTVADVPDLTQLSSATKPDPALYQISLDQALASGKPTAVLFGTPGFCKTATCGPSIEVLQALQKTYGAQINFIHVEVYKYPFSESFQKVNQLASEAVKQNRALTPDEQRAGFVDAMVAWHLLSEPWLFLIDRQGMIVARYEGGITKEEIGPALEKLIAGQPIF